MKNYIQKQAISFSHAFRGLIYMIKDYNSLIHLPAAIIVVIFAFVVGVEREEWYWLIAAIAVVWIAETFNTAIEKLVDLACPKYHPLAGKVKDISAAAVLLASIFAVVIGLLVFLPYFSDWVYPL
ncbi:diacylglycerol kinase family protein [Rapidithrix thailandica]|uniref:Diacylglycerol kinase family protein n=1 Tax=Rapidithrix thailandica TaxID=413964 RepID=A0AAW9S8Z1_9BACT